MGTHPIFESDFDCLTDMSTETSPSEKDRGMNLRSGRATMTPEKLEMRTREKKARKAASLQRFFMGKNQNSTSQNLKGENSEMKKNEGPKSQDDPEEFENNLKSPELTGNDGTGNLDTGRLSARKYAERKFQKFYQKRNSWS